MIPEDRVVLTLFKRSDVLATGLILAVLLAVELFVRFRAGGPTP